MAAYPGRGSLGSNPSSEFTIEAVEQHTQNMFAHPDNNVKQESNKFLMRFQEAPEAWSIASALLQKQGYAQFMAAQTLFLKAQRQWRSVPDEKQFVEGVITILPSCPTNVKQRLALCLAVCVAQVVAKSWKSAVQDVIGALQRANEHSAAITLASSLPEQASVVVHTYLKKSPTAQQLMAAFPFIVEENFGKYFGYLARCEEKICI